MSREQVMSKIQEGVLHNDTLDKNPFELFDEWYKEAEASELNDPDAMAIASVDKNGMPSVRIVLLKQWSQAGFTFFTNYTGRKGQELIATKKAAACLHWKSLRRQVRIVGDVDKISPSMSDAYFSTRARGSQIGAWASNQSQPLKTRAELSRAVDEYEKKFEGETVARPEHWGGFIIKPVEIEFWADGAYRLHDRFQLKQNAEGSWKSFRLNP